MTSSNGMNAHTSPEANPRRLDLRQMKLLALGCLVGAVALLAVAQWHGRTGAWAWVAAFAEAAAIGALADWFAVVALFRHPLGLPIPHTAIIPRNKARIARSLADFVAQHFLDRDALLQKLDRWNPAGRLGEFLSTPERLDALSTQLQRWVAHALLALDSKSFERELLQLVRTQLSAWNAAATVSQWLRILTRDDHHQRVLNAGLTQIADWLGQDSVRAFITEKLVTMARREFPRVLWLTDRLQYTEALGDALATRLADGIIDELQSVLSTPDHPLRQRYSAEAAKLMRALEDDPQLQARVAGLKQRLLDSPDLQAYVRQLWQRLVAWLHADLARTDSATMGQFRLYAERLGQRLRDDPLWQATGNAQIRIAAEHLANQFRNIAPRYIQQTVQEWDDDFLVREIERSVGRDLQFIRLNGTLIGGLAGLTLHALFRVLNLH